MEHKFHLDKKHNQNENEQLEKAAQVFLDYLNIKDEPEQSDTIFVLGGSTLDPVKKAAELYKNGYSSKIAFMGIGGTFGGDQVWGMPEYEMYKKTLVDLDIPENAILAEGIARNTLDEAQNSVSFLQKNGVDPKKIILVSRPVHQRRAFATFKKQHPEVAYINCPAEEPLNLSDVDFVKRLVGEAERLLDYSKKGDVEEQEIPYNVLRAAALLRIKLKNTGSYTGH